MSTKIGIRIVNSFASWLKLQPFVAARQELGITRISTLTTIKSLNERFYRRIDPNSTRVPY